MCLTSWMKSFARISTEVSNKILSFSFRRVAPQGEKTQAINMQGGNRDLSREGKGTFNTESGQKSIGP